jgi:hypothetical protein
MCRTATQIPMRECFHVTVLSGGVELLYDTLYLKSQLWYGHIAVDVVKPSLGVGNFI